MNERIRELAEQAGYTPLPGFDFANSIQEIYNQKFAELIIKECINVGKSVNLDTCQEEYALEQLLEIIGEHFGIKDKNP